MKTIRKMMCAIMAIMLVGAMAVSACETAYNDVKVRDYYGSAVYYVTSKNYYTVDGSNFETQKTLTNHDLKNSFLKDYVTDDDHSVSRENLAVVLKEYIDNNGFSYGETDKKEFLDEANISDGTKDAVRFLHRTDILNDNDNELFHPQANVTRGEFAMITMTMFESELN